MSCPQGELPIVMAEHHASSSQSAQMQAHLETYHDFIRGACGIAILCFYVLVALCSVAFAHTWPVFLAFAGIIVGILFLMIDLRSGSKRFLLSLGGLIVYALITAVNVS